MAELVQPRYPQVDFSALANLPAQFEQGQQLARDRSLRAAFSNGIPMNNGVPDYGAMAKLFAQAGDTQNAVRAAEAGATHQLAVSNYQKPHYSVSPNGEVINENAMDPSQVFVRGGANGGAPNPDYQYGKNPFQQKAATAATRAWNANQLLGATQSPDSGYEITSGIASMLPEGAARTFLSSSKRASFDAAANEFLDAIGENNPSGRTKYIPDFINDNADRLAEKARLRDEAIHAKGGEAGPLFHLGAPQEANQPNNISPPTSGDMTPTEANAGGALPNVPPVPGAINGPVLQGPGAAPPVPPARALNALRAYATNPQARAEFDKIYGEGASEFYLKKQR